MPRDTPVDSSSLLAYRVDPDIGGCPNISLATTYYRLKRKEDGDRERVLAQNLRAEQDAIERQGRRSKRVLR